MKATKKFDIPSSNRSNNEYVWETITPQLAKQYLASNIKNNRHIRRRVVDKYSRDMLSGNWDISSPNNSITFNSKGELVDGQHRLSAVIKAKTPIEMRVFRNNDSNVFDLGAGRSTKDYLKLTGQYDGIGQEEVTLARHLIVSLTKNDTPTNEEVRSIIDLYYDDLLLATHTTHTGKSGGRISNSVSCHTASFMALKRGHSDEELFDFYRMVNSGMPDIELNFAPALVLRRQLQQIKEIGGTGRVITQNKYRITTQALEDYFKGRTRQNNYKTTESVYTVTELLVREEIVKAL